MGLLGAAIAAAVGLPAIAGTLINIGLAVGLSYASRALSGAASATNETGIQSSIELGGDVPRGCVFGEAGTAGHFIYVNTANENNNLLQEVYRIGEGPHDDLTRIWVNGKARTLTLVEQTAYYKKYSVSGFLADNGVTPLLYAYFYFGYQDQPACAELVTWARPSGRWTSNDRLAGVCYVVISAFYSERAFDSGLPRFHFGVRGRRLYDWRLDSTNGGTGTHRWNDEKTWTFSANPVVQIYNFERGLYLNGELVVGKGTPPIDLLLPLYTAGANACDEPVSTIEGSDANRFTCGTMVSADEEYGSVIERILESCAGSMYDRVGANGPLVGVPQTVMYPTITDGDLVLGRPVKFAAKQGRDNLINGVFGSYVKADDQYQSVSYPAQTDASAEAADTEVRRVKSDYPTVIASSQAQRLAKIKLRLARLQATATITLGFRAVVLEPGDWVRWNSARYGDRTYIIMSLVRHKDRTVTLTLREIAASAYSWTVGEEQPAPAPGEAGDGGGLANSVTSFSLSALTMTGAGGTKTPAIRVYWSPIVDPTVTAVLIEYRIAGTTDAVSERATAPSAGEWLLASSLLGNTAYEVRATIETAPARDTVWTAWTSITTGDQVLVGVPPADSITPEQMTAATRDLVVTRAQAALADLQVAMSDVAMLLADVDASSEMNRQELTRSLAVQLGAATARFSEEIAAAVGPDSAIVAQITALEAAVGDVGSSLAARFVVGVTPAGALAMYELEATAGAATAGFRLITRDDGAGGAVGEIEIDGDRFYVSDGVDSVPVFLVDNTGPSPVIYLNGDLVAAGSITADKLNVAMLSAIVANLGEIIAGLLRSPDNRLRIELDNARILISSSGP